MEYEYQLKNQMWGNYIKDIPEMRKREIEDLKKEAAMVKQNIESLGKKPTDRQQKVFDIIDNLNEHNIYNVADELIEPKEIEQKEDNNNLKTEKKKKCIIF